MPRPQCSWPVRPRGGATGGAATLVDPPFGGGREGLMRVPAMARWIFVVNLPCYAARLQLAPVRWGPTENWRWRHFATVRCYRGFAI